VSDGWYYLSSRGHIGPLSLEELKETLAGFQNRKDVLVWSEGFPNWERAENVPELDVETLVSRPQTGSGRDRAGNPKLPLWDTIRLSYSTYFHNFPDVLRISWLWLAAAGILSWLLFSWTAGVTAAMKRGMPPSRPVETIVLVTIAYLVFTFAGASIAVAWHRRIILGEHPGFSGSNVATKSLWRYVWMGFVIALIAFLLSLAVVLPMISLSSSVITGAAPRFAMFIAACFLLVLTVFGVALRLSLLLPARAVGDLDLRFKETWKRTGGNTWRMFWGFVACIVPPMLAVQVAVQIVSSSFLILTGGMSDSNAIVGVAVIMTIVFVCNLLTLPIGIGFLSYSYSYFFGRT
jgi:uncharacterized protein DUF4339